MKNTNNDLYCYKDSNLLINKLGISGRKWLKECEKEIAEISAKMKAPIKGNFDFMHYKNMHEALFDGLYDWAGKIRVTNFYKNDYFCESVEIEQTGHFIFEILGEKKCFLSEDENEKVRSICQFICELFKLRAFRSGNWQVNSEFIKALCLINGIYFNISDVPNERFSSALEKGVNGELTELCEVFEKFSDEITKKAQIFSIKALVLDEELQEELLLFVEGKDVIDDEAKDEN